MPSPPPPAFEPERPPVFAVGVLSAGIVVLLVLAVLNLIVTVT